VFNILNGFSQWKVWSPWLIQEPEVKVTLSNNNKSYSWEGKRTGEGNMVILKEVLNKSVEYKLEFLKPWKSISNVRFEVFTVDNGTRVIWSMDGSSPFFMFWMKK